MIVTVGPTSHSLPWFACPSAATDAESANKAHAGKVAELSPANAAKAVAHPLRAAILERLYDREASPIALAKEMGLPIGNVSYHIRALHRLGAIALVRQRQVRGATEHYYTAVVRISVHQELV
jgi:DNA-binding transcriptional ArsR family regulator